MHAGFTAIPFKMDDKFSQIEGVGKFSGAGIILEYEGKLFGIIKNGIKESRIALDEILDVKLSKGVFKVNAKIEIRLKSFAKLSEIPNRDGRIVLKIVRADIAAAEQAILKLQKDLAETQANLPPVRTPVDRLFTDENEDD